MKVSVVEAKNKLTQLIQAVERGETVTICRHGHPVVDLVVSKTEERPVPKFGTGKGKIPTVDMSIFAPMTDEEVDALFEGRY